MKNKELFVKGFDIFVDIMKKKVIFVDDVLYIGRIVWVVMDVFMDLGRLF